MLKYVLLIIGVGSVPALSQSFPTLSSGRASCESLWVERNQILNVAGYCFETALGQAVFNNADCAPGMPALTDAALNRISRIEQAEQGRLCEVNTGRVKITINGRYSALRFGDGGITLGRWPDALDKLVVFPRDAGRERACTVTGLAADGDNFLALRNGPDVRYEQIGALTNGERVFSSSICLGRWCFAESVLSGNIRESRVGWFHMRWCTPQ